VIDITIAEYTKYA